MGGRQDLPGDGRAIVEANWLPEEVRALSC
jgi:hypothetical protein